MDKFQEYFQRMAERNMREAIDEYRKQTYQRMVTAGYMEDAEEYIQTMEDPKMTDEMRAEIAEQVELLQTQAELYGAAKELERVAYRLLYAGYGFDDVQTATDLSDEWVQEMVDTYRRLVGEEK